ncbi:hypothetical protein EYF80_058490 [Liparis tanakae]|uniref:Uncharacterized protein n=1 Tax=Liparis tanakae TaxID=230148 RepID=A0A4Z2ER92_9TELE|nr:hypothetical protein EYF80_058490 [Liparis tanakae]
MQVTPPAAGKGQERMFRKRSLESAGKNETNRRVETDDAEPDVIKEMICCCSSLSLSPAVRSGGAEGDERGRSVSEDALWARTLCERGRSVARTLCERGRSVSEDALWARTLCERGRSVGEDALWARAEEENAAEVLVLAERLESQGLDFTNE